MSGLATSGRLLNAREVAVLLGVSTETVLRWVRLGKLPAIRLPGGAVRFRPDELDQWLTAGATFPATLPVTRPATTGETA